jgi:drug/metabolite transporter (DMT)-like permease
VTAPQLSGDLLVGVAAGLGAALVYGVCAVVQARAVRALPSGTRGFGAFVREGLRHPLLLAVLAAYGVGFALHAVAIALLPLYLAQAGIAMALPVTALCSAWLSETVGGRQWVALLSVVAGVVLMSLGAGAAGAVQLSPWFAAGCLLAAGLLGLVTVSGRVRSGAGLGALAGLGYAGVAVSVRGVSWPLETLGLGAALACALFGVLAFWLYSQGLEAADVSVSTATVVVGETVAPAVVGLTLLGDGIRAGWAVWVVVGLALAVAGAVAVGHVAEDRLTRERMGV